ncbi:MAG: hypothetical protein JWR34_602, partial [Mycobacterium sp.]|nr:hypothetical protein [Mycobacterium sp.]
MRSARVSEMGSREAADSGSRTHEARDSMAGLLRR